MPGTSIPSRCSTDVALKFHWFDAISYADNDPIEVAVKKCMDAVTGRSRVWNPFARSMIVAEFRSRLKKAAAGSLKPVDEVKDVGENPSEPLYEIRWQNLAVTDFDVDSESTTHYEVMVRLYHSEPQSEPEYFIGHHVHEKIIDGSHTWDLQTAEIQVAIKYFRLGESVGWGIVHACDNP